MADLEGEIWDRMEGDYINKQYAQFGQEVAKDIRELQPEATLLDLFQGSEKMKYSTTIFGGAGIERVKSIKSCFRAIIKNVIPPVGHPFLVFTDRDFLLPMEEYEWILKMPRVIWEVMLNTSKYKIGRGDKYFLTHSDFPHKHILELSAYMKLAYGNKLPQFRSLVSELAKLRHGIVNLMRENQKEQMLYALKCPIQATGSAFDYMYEEQGRNQFFMELFDI